MGVEYTDHLHLTPFIEVKMFKNQHFVTAEEEKQQRWRTLNKTPQEWTNKKQDFIHTQGNK